MSSEERIVRPYLGVDRLQHVLDGFSLQAGGDVVGPGNALKLTPSDFLARAVDLRVAGNGTPLENVRQHMSSAFEEAGSDPVDLEMLVVASTSRLKIAEIVWRLPMTDLHQLDAAVPLATGAARPSALQTPFGGCRIDLFVVLRHDLDPAPLHPWRKGTWLGHISFDISTDLGEIGFTPLPLDDDIRHRYDVPAKTNRFVRVEAVLDPDAADDALELYVDVDVLAQLAQFPSTPAARAFQRQLFMDAAQAIVLEAVRSPELLQMGPTDIEGTLVGKLVAVAAGRAPGESQAQRQARQDNALSILRSEPNRFMAWLDAEVSDRNELTGALTGAQS